MDVIWKIAAGLFAGVVSGMGIGGGAVLIPVLTLLLGFEQKAAQGVNLLYFIPTGAAALWVHFKNKSIDVKSAWILASFGVAGAVAGAFSARAVPADLLRRLFAVLMIGVGVNEFLLAVKRNK
ncbi:MAG: sulfite exporter TauE/SafE family protein [Clostridiales bacterium]|jgi:uncharacterized membrane protein YfcA|nr:sulfite exporter TauE/SafE family protein [Clostridiales bacterium]